MIIKVYIDIGVISLGGLIKKEDYKKYEIAAITPIHLANNFNDQASAFVTLFSVILGNLTATQDMFNIATD